MTLSGRLRWPGFYDAAIALLVGFLAHGVWLGCVLFSLQQGVPAGIVALVASLFYLGPPVTMIMAWVAFGDRLQSTDVIGLIIVAAGVIVVQRQ
ncbi:MAG: EamA family transporter [Thermodesulfobacteriota bacterium]|uniref:EamA family transporter n=1 Tax=Desulfosalsimonas sp. TaxID=3073848 RepID=UPI0039705188